MTMIKRKTAICIECNQLRLVYAKKKCQTCYWKSKPKKPIQKKNTPIPKRSKKGIKEDRIYYQLAKKFKEDYPYCKAKLNGCTHLTTDVHHMKSRGINLNKIEYWLPLCRNCHNKITEDSAFAIREGFSFSRNKIN